MHKKLTPASTATSHLWEGFGETYFWQNVLFFTEIKLIATNQTGFKPGHFCINQILPLTHDSSYYKSFDEGYTVRGVSLDLSNAFDKV